MTSLIHYALCLVAVGWLSQGFWIYLILQDKILFCAFEADDIVCWLVNLPIAKLDLFKSADCRWMYKTYAEFCYRGPACDVLYRKYGGLFLVHSKEVWLQPIITVCPQYNKYTRIKSVNNSILLNRLHTAMITVLNTGSNLLFGVNRLQGLYRNSATVRRIVQSPTLQTTILCGCPSDLRGKGIRVSPAWLGPASSEAGNELQQNEACIGKKVWGRRKK